MAVKIPVLARRRFEYSYLGGTATQEIVLQRAIETHDFSHLHLFVRVHERDMALGQSFDFALYYTLPSDEDPREFTNVTALTTVSVSSTQPSSIPGIVHTAEVSPGAFLKLVLTAKQAVSPATLYAEMSAILILREFGPR